MFLLRRTPCFDIYVKTNKALLLESNKVRKQWKVVPISVFTPIHLLLLTKWQAVYVYIQIENLLVRAFPNTPTFFQNEPRPFGAKLKNFKSVNF